MRAEICSSPAIPEGTFGPIPEDVEDNLRFSIGGVVDRRADADIGPDVLAFASGDLHLRDEVEVGSGAVCVCTYELDHRSEEAAETVIGRHRPACGGAEEESAGRFVRVEGDIAAELKLEEVALAEELVVGEEGLEGGGTCAEAAVAVAAGRKKASLCTKDGAGRKAGEELAFEADRDVAEPRGPVV